MFATNYYAPGCHKLQTKSEIFSHNIQPVKSDVLIFHFVCIKNRRHGHRGTKGWGSEFGARSSCGRKHANWFPAEPLCNVAIAGNLSAFFGSPVFRIQGINLGRCPEMQTHGGGRSRLLQTKLQSAVCVSRPPTAINVTIYFVLKRFSG